ncbi:hypothetical protein Nos7524_2681 [Nostoc sp. PCC 7524]|uniref:DUF6335 family protein n=1 Tax=Nostoc sp. (strain ATCC 29411 / PCC 7524) TaxID=28072 RepID=UPI00029F40F3|nr:hypothetical protein Nos7524_2681 [Nostoc sp. PCC 7524]
MARKRYGDDIEKAKIMTEQNNNQEEINLDNLPQEITESYGTGVKDLPGYNIGGRSLQAKRHEYTDTSPELTGGDIDAYWQDADTVGDEAVGGTAPTPDQNVTEDIEKAVGLEMDDRAFLRTNDILEQRDDRRWELDPKSSEDYEERR